MSEPRVTLVQVAQRAGVSKTTAGYVLSGRDQQMRISEQTRHEVLRAAAEMNYRPNLMARSLRTPVARPIAIISDTLVTEPYGGELVGGCLAAAAEHGRLAFIAETRRDPRLETALVDELLTEQVEDFVFATVYPREIRVPPQLRDRRVVMLNCAAAEPGVTTVLPDEVGAGEIAARHLLDDASVTDGIVLVGDRAPHPYAPGRDREEGLHRTLEAAGAGLDHTIDCAWEPESAYVAVSAALASGLRPRALICLNDRAAFGAYQALGDAGLRIPDDVVVLAFEGSDLASWLRPQLTTVDRDLRAMGRRAIEALTAEDPSPALERHPLILRTRASTVG